MRITLLLLLFLCGCAAPLAQQRGQQQTYTVYLPHILKEVDPEPPVKVPCWESLPAYAFFWLLRIDARQQHGDLICDPRLVRAAANRALAQPLTGLSHCDVFGLCANVYVRRAGFPLPTHYAPNGNNVESLMGGAQFAVDAFNALARSPAHAMHLFGENEFFRQQKYIGIAMVEVPNHRYRWVWVIIITDKGIDSGE